MAEFMDENRPAEEDDDEDERPSVREEGLEVGRHGNAKLRFKFGESSGGDAASVGVHG